MPRLANCNYEMPDATMDTTALNRTLAEAALADGATFPEALLSHLCEALALSAASLYLCTAESAAVRLRAQHGLNYNDYVQFELPPESLPARTASGRETLVVATVDNAMLHGNKRLRRRAGITSCVMVPLVAPDPPAPQQKEMLGSAAALGSLCLYVAQPDTLPAVTTAAEAIAPFVARLYLATVERAAVRLRRRVVDRVAYRRDVGSLAHNYLELVKDELSVEAAALWVLDARRNLLYRRKALKPRTPEGPGVWTSLRLTDPSLIVDCFRTRIAVTHDARRPILTPDDLDLALETPFANWTAMPILLPPEAKLRGRNPSAAGVLELSNHVTRLGGVTHPTSVTWEEEYLAAFTCELISVLIYQILRTQDHESDYERMLHGAKTSLLGARSHLQALEQFDLERYLPPRARYFIPNAIDWLEDLEGQINRDDIVNKGRVQLEPISLYGDVLAKLEVMLSRMNTRNDERRLTLRGLDDLAQTFRQVPRVIGNRQALDCVFRNLIDNSRKYCRPPTGEAPSVKVGVQVSSDHRKVFVIVADNGAPIAEDEVDLVFQDGFRGMKAQGVQPQGVGRGLYDCRRLLKQMRGNITIVPAETGVAFRIELRASHVSDTR